jgi:predicted enzyme related to lactoylglutathione lyase
MAQAPKLTIGTIAWTDLTVPETEKVRDFYKELVGWESSPVDIGENYQDYNMMPPGSETPVAGICHAMGVNAGIPPQWMIYIVVEDLEQCKRRCVELGGKVLMQHPSMHMCVIQDPAGAVCALYAAPSEPAQ